MPNNINDTTIQGAESIAENAPCNSNNNDFSLEEQGINDHAEEVTSPSDFDLFECDVLSRCKDKDIFKQEITKLLQQQKEDKKKLQKVTKEIKELDTKIKKNSEELQKVEEQHRDLKLKCSSLRSKNSKDKKFKELDDQRKGCNAHIKNLETILDAEKEKISCLSCEEKKLRYGCLFQSKR